MNGRVDLSYSAYPGRAFTYRVHQSGHGRAYGSAQDPQKSIVPVHSQISGGLS